MTSDQALLRLGESTAEAVANVLRSYAGDALTTGPVTLAAAAEQALQTLPGTGVITSVSYVDGVAGGNVFVISRAGAHKLALLMMGGDLATAGDGELSELELSAVGEATNQMLSAAAAATSAVLGEEIEIAPPTTYAYKTPAEALKGIDLSPRATSVSFTIEGEGCRLVQLIPNAFLIRMTRAFGDLGAETRTEVLAQRSTGGSIASETVRQVPLTLRASLGRSKLSLHSLSNLRTGAALVLDRSVDDPVELFVNGQRFGAGELITTDGRWAVRITQITTGSDKQRT